jgi:DNA polymerase III subunit epsilon
MRMVDFVAIDFETANEKHNSPCAIGLAVVKDGVLTEEVFCLIKPPTDYFRPFNISIHGITWNDVREQPEFDVVFSRISGFFNERTILAHNASFDISVLRKTLGFYGIVFPQFNYACTMRIARRMWPGLVNYRLDTVCNFLGIDLHRHHDASEDARACALIALRACNETKSDSIPRLLETIGTNASDHSEEYDSSHSRGQGTNPNIDMPPVRCESLAGKAFVFTGTLQSMKRDNAKALVIGCGGTCIEHISKDMDFLVMGEQDLRALRGESKSSKLRKVEEMIAKGASIEVIGEVDFLEMVAR